MKKSLLLAGAVLLRLAALAQDHARLNLEAEVAQPLQSGLSTGVTCSDRILINPDNTKGQALVVLSVSGFGTRNNPVIQSLVTLSLRGGYRLLVPRSRLFFEGEAGGGLLWTSIKGASKNDAEKDFVFSYAAGAGLFLKENQRLNLALHYGGNAGKNDHSWISLGLGLTISRH